MRPRGRLTAQHLATRERPGEVVLALGFLSFFAVTAAFNVVYCLFHTPASPALATELTWVAVGNALAALWLGVCFLGLRRLTRWGWWLSTLTLGLLLVAFLLAFVLSALEGRDDAVFLNSLAGLILSAAVTCVVGAPFFLLVKVRRRYLNWRSPP